MNVSQARNLVERYIEGWIKQDSQTILSTLSSNCVIRESHGPIYQGHEIVARWVDDWHREGSTVDLWRITSFCFIEEFAFFEWHFVCTVSDQEYEFDGASILKFEGGKIAELREYRMTASPYEWKPQ